MAGKYQSLQRLLSNTQSNILDVDTASNKCPESSSMCSNLARQ